MNCRLFCKVMGLVFLAIAAWGFIDGHQVLIFHVNMAHNIVHLLSGLAALACGFTSEHASRLFCFIFGTIYALVGVLGLAGVPAVTDLLHLNPADNWLHLALAAVFLIAGFMSLPRSVPPGIGTPQPT